MQGKNSIIKSSSIQMLFDTSKAILQQIHDDLFVEKQVNVQVLRLDLLHPVVSGNKLFKLHYFLTEALAAEHKTILTFGGAYSNHLAATAYACRLLGLNCIGIVRGEEPPVLSPTLQQCINDGMQLQFVSRQVYDDKKVASFVAGLQRRPGDYCLVPEGGFHPLGAKGAALIMDLLQDKPATHICTASGTATTTAGLVMAAHPAQQIISIPVLKGITDTATRIQELTGKPAPANLQVLPGYHFGGYAKKNDELITFMNHCRLAYQLPLDFVYTAKMFFGVMDSIRNNYFEPGSEIICLHTGGLQGNKSLPLNTILF